MSLVVLRYLAMIIGPSLAATARPATTFFAIQITVVALVYREVAAVPEAFDWLVSAPIIAIVGVLAVLEMIAAHDPDISAILRDLRIDRVAGAFGALSAALLFSALGMPEAEAAALVATDADLLAASGGLLDATGAAAGADFGTIAQTGVLALALAINVVMTGLRSQFLLFIYEFELGRYWARLESGGVVGVLILLPLFPVLIFGFFVLIAVALTALSVASRAATRAMDDSLRAPCDNCGHRLRVEASLCPECGVDRSPTAQPSSGLQAAVAAFRQRNRH